MCVWLHFFGGWLRGKSVVQGTCLIHLLFFRRAFSAMLMCLTYSLQNKLYWHFLFPLAVFGKPLHVPGLSVSINRPGTSRTGQSIVLKIYLDRDEIKNTRKGREGGGASLTALVWCSFVQIFLVWDRKRIVLDCLWLPLKCLFILCNNFSPAQ